MSKEIDAYLRDNEIMILSGEGNAGTFRRFTGKRTTRAIRSRLARERCNGDRWAKAYVYLHESDSGNVYLNTEDVSDMRVIDEEDISD